MALNYVTLTCDLYDGQGNALITGAATLTPSAQLTDTTDHEIITQAGITVAFRPGGPPAVNLLATDNGNVLPAGWAWTIAFTGISGSPASYSFFLPFAGGASQYLSALSPLAVAPAMSGFMPLPTGTASNGQVPIATGAGSASAWGYVVNSLAAADSSVTIAGSAPTFTLSSVPAQLAQRMLCV